ncbi:MAG: rhomboid family intramembrane serine protease, partial [Enterobacteriaceae bacterium]|nr:rhomboid family intramembrane serine protease [Enterobacteriaceae bacterium]
HALMHFSVLHILFNLLWWWYLGGTVEKRLGSGKLVVITVISALLSGFVQYHFSGPWFGGLSGVVYALMGYAWLRGERDPQSGVFLPRGLIGFALIWLIAGWFDLFGMSIANGAHVAGLLVGLAMAFVDSQNARKRT